MATKPVKTVIYLDGLLPIKSHDPLMTWSFTWQTKMRMSTRFSRTVTYADVLLPRKSRDPLITGILWDQVASKNMADTVPMITKLGILLTYHKGLFPIKLHHLLVTWSCKVAWQSKIISPIPLSLATKFGRMDIRNGFFDVIFCFTFHFFSYLWPMFLANHAVAD